MTALLYIFQDSCRFLTVSKYYFSSLCGHSRDIFGPHFMCKGSEVTKLRHTHRQTTEYHYEDSVFTFGGTVTRNPEGTEP